MRWVYSVGVLALLSGCADYTLVKGMEQNVMSSLPFDETPCSSLKAERSALMAAYHLPIDAKPEFAHIPAGLEVLVPDWRSRATKDRQQAAGRISAISHSLMRRKGVKCRLKGRTSEATSRYRFAFSLSFWMCWCGREDSNFHGLPHSDLNAARLPIPPRPHVTKVPVRTGPRHVANQFRRNKCGMDNKTRGNGAQAAG